MESLDRNGTYEDVHQPAYLTFNPALHNMKSRVEFGWQNNDPSVQGQVGLKYKLNREHKEIRKQYEQTLDKRIYKKYVEHDMDNYSFLRDLQKEKDNRNGDILTREVQNFNNSKIFTPLPERRSEGMRQSAHIQERDQTIRPQKAQQQYERLNQSQNIIRMEDSPPVSPRYARHQEYQARYNDPQDYRDGSETKYRQDRPYNPQNYQTLNPTTDRYRPFEPHPVNYNYDYPVPQRSQKMLSSVVPSDYPLRNVIPDKLENHLREKVKAGKKNAVKVTLNLFDYNKR